MNRIVVLLALVALGGISCTKLAKVTETHKGMVIDADSKRPIAQVKIEVTVMRESSYDGLTRFHTYEYATDNQGRFHLPARKKITDAMTQKMEDERFFEKIRFQKDGYGPREFSSDDEDSPFHWFGATERFVTVEMKSGG